VRLVDVERQTFTVVCETCGHELPIGALNLIDSLAVGTIMLEHAKEHIDGRECCECGKRTASEDNTWQPGEVCLFGMLFACSLTCAENYAAKNARDGYRPGQPGFDAVVEPGRRSSE
jgi:hypothetical protein